MVLLIVMGGFFPGKKYGGPPVSVDNFCSLMKDRCECYIVTSNHDLGDYSSYSNISEGWNDRGNAKVKYVADSDYNSSTFETVIREISPDYIYLQGLFQGCVLPCLRLAKKHHIKVVLAPRGELCGGAFHKKYKKIPYIIFLRIMDLLKDIVFQSTSDEETEAIGKYLGVKPERIHLLTNIPSIPANLPERNEKKVGTGRFVFISRILWKKNLLSAIGFLKEIKGNVIFDIYGPQEDLNYWEECEKAISELPINVHVKYRGILIHDDIHKTFCKYDAFLFPTLSENFGHVIAEALLTGCIPIISDQTPWTDMNDSDSGWAISLSNEQAFKNAIQRVVYMDEIDIQKKRKNIEKYFSKKLNLEKQKEDYLKMFK